MATQPNSASVAKKDALTYFFWPTPRTKAQSSSPTESLPEQYAAWLVRLRWLAIIVASGLALINQTLLHYLEPGSMVWIWGTIGTLALFNVFCQTYSDTLSWTRRYGLHLQIGFDLVALTALLHCSGGIENPLSFVYVFHVILSAIIFKRQIAIAVVILSTVLIGAVAWGEWSHTLEHYTLVIFPHFQGEEGDHHAAHNLTYATTRVGMHFLFMSLTSGFVITLMERLHDSMRETRQERIQLQHVIRSTGIGLAIIENGESIQRLNPHDDIWKPIGGQSDSAIWRKWLRELAQSASERTPSKDIGYERSYALPGGTTRHYHITLASLNQPDEDARTMAALVFDVTERKRIEDEMSHAARIAMLGRVSAGIAHEVGNPLASISTRLTLLEDAESLEEIKSGLVPLKSQVARINRIVRGVSQIARPQKGDWERFDLRSVTNDVLEVLHLHKGSKNCSIDYNPPAKPILIKGVKDQINQVFLNLGLNALDAMSRGGRLSIEFQQHPDSVVIHFSDTGVGMTQEQLERVFDLFFTTKENGLGIGMHIAYQIVEAHRGAISVSSEPGHGTRFTITLPTCNSG